MYSSVPNLSFIIFSVDYIDGIIKVATVEEKFTYHTQHMLKAKIGDFLKKSFIISNPINQ